MAISGRIYTLSFQNVTVSAAQDLLAVYAGASKIFAVLSVNIGQVTATSVANQRIRLRYLPATVTSGSGGSAVTPRAFLPGDSAATITGRANDTTQASTGGTAVDIWTDGFNVINGFLWVPPISARPPVIGLNGAFVVSLDTTPASFIMNGSVTVEELP